MSSIFSHRLFSCLLVIGTLVLGSNTGNAAAPKSTEKVKPVPRTPSILVTINGKKINEQQFTLWAKSQKIPHQVQIDKRKQLLEKMIDQLLMADYLKQKKIVADAKMVEMQIQRIYQQIRKTKRDPKKVLAEWGQTEESLKKELALPIAWSQYARKTITTAQMKQRFTARRKQFDGTELRARQIVLKLLRTDKSTTALQKIEKMKKIRKAIEQKTISFADAAKKHSTSPTAKKGGDLGFFPYKGRMPTSITQIAFSLKKNELSQPFLTPYGVHLIQITDERPGQLSLEDARPELFKQLAKEHWKTIIKQSRSTAKIKWLLDQQP